MPKIGKVTKVAQATYAVRGLSKHFAKEGTHLVAGVRTTQPQLIALFESHLAAIRKSDAARAALGAAVREEARIARAASAMIQRLKLSVYSMFGPDPGVFGDFGWRVPRKRGPKTARGKAEGVRKRAARRAQPR
jgi:hypothetical protein